MKRNYDELSIEVVEFSVNDLITTSGFDGDEQDFGTNYPAANL